MTENNTDVTRTDGTKRVEELLDEVSEGRVVRIEESDDYHSMVDVYLDSGEWFSIGNWGTYDRNDETDT